MLLEIAVVLGLVLINGFFAMSELAVVSSRRARLQQLRDEGSRGAAIALELAADPTGFLSTVQVGITLVGILAGAYSGATLSEPLAGLLAGLPGIGTYAPTVAFILVVVATTYASLIIGELVPKRLALANAERIAIAVARPMRLLATIGAPIVWFLRTSTELVLRLLRVRPKAEEVVSQEEIQLMIAEGAERGVFEKAEHAMIEGVMRFADRSVRAMMTPRFEVEWLPIDASLTDLKTRIAQTGHSRYPLCRGSIDEVVGIVQASDVLRALPDEEGATAPAVASLAREPLFIHESTRALRLLEMFRDTPTRFAVVVDEYGGVQGIATLNDILTSIAGEFPDAADRKDPNIVRRGDGSFLIDGMTPVDEVAHLLGLRSLRDEDGREDDYETLAGFMLWRLGHLPEIAETLEWKGLRFEVVDLDGRRIDKVLVSGLPGAAADSADRSDI